MAVTQRSDNSSEILAGDAFFLPDVCTVRSALTVVFISQLFALIIVLAQRPDPRPWFEHLALVSLFVQWITLCAAAVLCAAREPLKSVSTRTGATICFLLVVVIAGVIAEIAWWVVTVGGVAPAILGSEYMQDTHGGFLARSIGITALVALVVLRYFYIQRQWQLRTASESRARIEVLKARIRPHFFFNCMNTIASLVSVEPRAAEQAIEDLADLFRASLADAGDTVAIKEEIALTKQYLAIEQLRLGQRLQVNWHVDPLTEAERLPTLTLQPLVENAIYHGIEPLDDGGQIDISITTRDSFVDIEVANPVAAGADSGHQGNRLAQENIAHRIAAYFGERGGMKIDAVDDSYRVRVTVPAAVTA